MKNLHISVRKILIFLCVLAVFPCAILLTACGGGENNYQCTLDAAELFFGYMPDCKVIAARNGETSLRGPAYYDYSAIKVLVDGKEVNGFFNRSESNHNTNGDVYIGTINPRKLTSNAKITVTGIKDRYVRFSFVDFKNTQEYQSLKARYESYHNDYTTSNAIANDASRSEDERAAARGAADYAANMIDAEFDGIMSGFEVWYAKKLAFSNGYALKLSAKDYQALTTAPLKDQIVEGTVTTYGSLVSQDGYLGLQNIDKIKNGDRPYEFEYTYKELTTRDEVGFTIGMLPIESLRALGKDSIVAYDVPSNNGNSTLYFNRVNLIGHDGNNQAIYGKTSDYYRDLVLSVNMYNQYNHHVKVGDDYASRLYLKMNNLDAAMNPYTTYAIDPTAITYANFSLQTANRSFNDFVKLERMGFVLKNQNLGTGYWELSQLGNLYIFTNENGAQIVNTEKINLYRITVENNPVVYHTGLIEFDGDNVRMGDVDWTSYLYYDTANQQLTNISTPDDTSNPNLIQIKRSMVEDITEQANVLITENDIEYYYQQVVNNGNSNSDVKFSAANNSYTFDILLDNHHNINWDNVTVKVGGFANNQPVNLVALNDTYGSYEIKDYLINDTSLNEIRRAKVLHCVLNVNQHNPIDFINNKTDLNTNIGFTSDAYTTYFIQVEGADFSQVTGMVKIKGTNNVNPDAFVNYDNGNLFVYDNADGTAYVAISDVEVYGTEITGPHFMIYGQNFYDYSSVSRSMYYVSDIKSLTIGVKKDGTTIKTINAKKYLTDHYSYNNGEPIALMYGGNGGYYFNETQGNYKYHVFICADETFDGQINATLKYLSSIRVIVEDISGTNPSENLQGFFEFDFNIMR